LKGRGYREIRSFSCVGPTLLCGKIRGKRQKDLFVNRKIMPAFSISELIVMASKKEKEKEEKELDIFQSELVPKHDLLNQEEKVELLKKFNITLKQLPRIKQDDAAVKILNAKRGDIVKVMRKSPVATEYYYYRVVV
jgi:DNA-directed RNA polymerase subunit H (RpoH/RPB5)